MTNKNEIAVLNPQNIEIIGTASNVLLSNQTSVSKALEVGSKIITAIESNGMSDALDENCNNYLVKLGKTEKAMKEKRMVITGIFDQVKSEFTSLEKQVGKSGDVAKKIQAHRNAWAKKKAEQAEIEKRKQELLLNQQNERVEVRQKALEVLEDKFTKYLQLKTDTEYNNFMSVPAEQMDNYVKVLEKMNVNLNTNTLYSGEFKPALRYIQETEIPQILESAIAEVKQEHIERYWGSMDELRINLIEKAPGRKQELIQLAETEKKNKAEAERMKQEQAAREAKEKADREAAAAKAKEEQKQKIAAASEAAKMNNMFEATPAVPDSKAQVKKSWKITVTHQKGYMEIFSLYFQKEGMESSIDELGKKSLNQMVKYCEKLAKDGEKITSKYIKYDEDFTAVNKA